MALTRRENERLTVGAGQALTETEAALPYTLAGRARKRLHTPSVLTRTHSGLKAAQVVGVLAIPGKTFEILPKIDGDDGALRAIVDSGAPS